MRHHISIHRQWRGAARLGTHKRVYPDGYTERHLFLPFGFFISWRTDAPIL